MTAVPSTSDGSRSDTVGSPSFVAAQARTKWNGGVLSVSCTLLSTSPRSGWRTIAFR
jgi:hypothetical protein